MDRESFYVGLGMLFAPIIIYLGYLLIQSQISLIQSQIDWGTIGLALLGFAYFGTAIFLLIKGALTKN